MSNEGMTNSITDVPSAIAELLAVNKQLEKEIESIKLERDEFKKYSTMWFDKKNELAQELQKTREQLDIATKHISKLLDIESHYEDCSYHSDDDTCDCGNESNYYKPARDFCINVKDKQGE